MTALATDNFSAGTNFTAVSAHNKGGFDGDWAPGFADGNCAAYQSAYGTWPDNQYAQAKVTVVSTNDGQGAGPLCRHVGGAYYYVRCSTTATTLYKYYLGVRTQIGSGSAVATNSIVKLECNGTTLKVYDDGVEIISTTDSDLTGGEPGMWGWGGTGSFGTLDDWEAGDIAVAVLPVSLHQPAPIVLAR